jgi:hypothetical protein
MSPNETSTGGEEIYRRVLLQEILQELRDIKKEQRYQGKDIARLQVRTGVIASTFGLLAGLVVVGFKAMVTKLVGNG